MSSPVVIQGTPVGNPHQSSTYSGGSELQNSEKQSSGCNDPLFAALFYICVIAIVAVAAMYAPDAMQDTESGSTNDYTGYVIGVAIITIISFFGAGAGMAVMMCIPGLLIKASLIFVVVLMGVWAVMSLLSGSIFAGIMGLLFFAVSLCYARAVWSRIPFATINLVTACTAIRKHYSVTVFAYLFTALAGVWSIVWSLAFIGVFDSTYECDAAGVCSDPNYGYLFLLFLAFFFGHQVVQNSIHVTIAGTVGAWWFEPDSTVPGCCDSNVLNAFLRTVTTSFGSICFGSLLVAFLQALRALANTARENDDMAIFACIAECILNCLASIMEYFNKWAFIYVGLYGMPYLKAGKSVFELFANRGWEAVIADDLVGNVLFMVSLVVGGLMGAIGLIINASSDLFEDAGGNSKAIAFSLGFFVGLAVTSVLMSTIGSAVNAVIVLFAEAPTEFQQNHPVLSQEMRDIWNQVYPGSI